MTSFHRRPELPPVVPYFAGRARHRSWLPLAAWLGLLQFVWIFIWILEPLGWDRPKQMGIDSLYFFATGAPSIGGLVAAALAARHHATHTRRIAPLLLSLFLCLVATALIGWIARGWFYEVWLDPNGRWYPL